MNDLRERLERAADYYIENEPANHPDRQLYEFVLAHGREYKGRSLPSHFEKGEAKKCYTNAMLLAQSEPELYYTEGFAESKRMPHFHHAWCVDKYANTYDPTLDEPKDYQFFGVPFISKSVQDLMERDWRYYGPVIVFLARNPDRLEEFLMAQ